MALENQKKKKKTVLALEEFQSNGTGKITEHDDSM